MCHLRGLWRVILTYARIRDNLSGIVEHLKYYVFPPSSGKFIHAFLLAEYGNSTYILGNFEQYQILMYIVGALATGPYFTPGFVLPDCVGFCLFFDAASIENTSK